MNLINLKMNLKHKMWENLKESSNFVNALYMLTLSVSFAHSLCLPASDIHTNTHTHICTHPQIYTHISHTHIFSSSLSLSSDWSKANRSDGRCTPRRLSAVAFQSVPQKKVTFSLSCVPCVSPFLSVYVCVCVCV